MGSAMRWAHQVSSVGFELVIPIAGGAWLDHTFHTKPWLTLLGVLTGSVLSFLGLMRLIQALDKSKLDKQVSESLDQNQTQPKETTADDPNQSG
jgi:F0F1-type ATP synthase assembly protein I